MAEQQDPPTAALPRKLRSAHISSHQQPSQTSSCCLACPCLAFVRSFLTWSSQKRRRCRLFEGSLTTPLCREQNNPNVDTRDKKSVALEYSCDQKALLTKKIRTTRRDHENRISHSHENDAWRLLYSTTVLSRGKLPECNEGSWEKERYSATHS